MAPPAQKRSGNEKDSPSKAARREMSDTPCYGLDVVTVEVGAGDQKQLFTSHKSLLSRHSDFFRAALSQHWKEGQDNEVQLKDSQPEVFQIFQHFIYSGKIRSKKEGDLEDRDQHGHYKTDREWIRLGEAWSFGEKMLSISFKDAIVDMLIEKIVLSNTHPTSIQDTLYPASPAEAKIRSLVVDIAVYAWADKTFTSLKSSEPSEFYRDLAIALHKTKQEDRKGSAPYKAKNTCKYHEHGDSVACYKELF